jgi:hypothetical protein
VRRGRNASLLISYYHCQQPAMKWRSRISLVGVRQMPPNGLPFSRRERAA